MASTTVTYLLSYIFLYLKRQTWPIKESATFKYEFHLKLPSSLLSLIFRHPYRNVNCIQSSPLSHLRLIGKLLLFQPMPLPCQSCSLAGLEGSTLYIQQSAQASSSISWKYWGSENSWELMTSDLVGFSSLNVPVVLDLTSTHPHTPKPNCFPQYFFSVLLCNCFSYAMFLKITSSRVVCVSIVHRYIYLCLRF